MLSSLVIGHIALVGIGATAVMDAWLALLSRLGVPTTSFALVGRWVGHLTRGQFAHAAISRAEPVDFELGLGWLTHYWAAAGFEDTRAAEELPAQPGQSRGVRHWPVPGGRRSRLHRTNVAMTTHNPKKSSYPA